MTEENTDLPRFPEPYWRSALAFPSFSKLDTDLTTDVSERAWRSVICF
ncbi:MULTISPECIES: hypothetical protein [Peribacillus]|nr:hypothetical protein [Peribacillus frigoritolerans]MEC0297166.1 hypothetical protein [Peribacillus castrilensis]